MFVIRTNCLALIPESYINNILACIGMKLLKSYYKNDVKEIVFPFLENMVFYEEIDIVSFDIGYIYTLI